MAIDAGEFKLAATLTFENVDKLRREAAAPGTGESDRETLERAACVALRSLARLDEQPEAHTAEIATRDRLQADCVPKPSHAEVTPPPVEDKPEQKPVIPDPIGTRQPQSVTPVQTLPSKITKKTTRPAPLRTNAITTGALGGAVLVGAAIMAIVVARPADERDCPARGCLAGSFNKAYAAAKASTTDSDPTNDVAYGAGDHICSESSRAANPDVAEACHQRDQLKAGMFASLAVGAVLGGAALVTGILHVRKTRIEPPPRTTFTVRPVVGRAWMLSATLRF